MKETFRMMICYFFHRKRWRRQGPISYGRVLHGCWYRCQKCGQEQFDYVNRWEIYK